MFLNCFDVFELFCTSDFLLNAPVSLAIIILSHLVSFTVGVVGKEIIYSCAGLNALFVITAMQSP